MRLEITDIERELLLELTEEKQKQFIHELDHTDSRDYRVLLRRRLEILEGLQAKVQSGTEP
jgi:hypothetical protein